MRPHAQTTNNIIRASDDSSEWSYNCDEASCSNATVICPTSADCHIRCDDTRACYNATIMWPDAGAGYGTLSCTGPDSCVDVNHPVPDPQKDYTLVCGQDACTTTTGGATIHCPRNADCHLTCDELRSCYQASINWPETGYGTMSCGGKEACQDVEHPIPEPNTDYTVSCGGYESCKSSTIRCPSNAICTVSCANTAACYGAKVEWYDYLGVLECAQGVNLRKSCFEVEHPVPPPNDDFSIDCLGEGTCQYGYLHCPANASCVVTCGGSYNKVWSCKQVCAHMQHPPNRLRNEKHTT